MKLCSFLFASWDEVGVMYLCVCVVHGIVFFCVCIVGCSRHNVYVCAVHEIVFGSFVFASWDAVGIICLCVFFYVLLCLHRGMQ